MASFLDSNGITHLWNKLKELISDKEIPIATDKTVGGILVCRTNYELNFSGHNPSMAINENRCYAVQQNSKGNGKAFVSVPWVSYERATKSKDGLMSAADKAKLDGIAENANNYTLPTCSGNTLGGIKTGFSQSQNHYALHVDADGNGYVQVPWTDTTYGVATTSADGLMPKLPTEPYYGWYGGNVFTPDMQFIGGDGKWKSLDIKFEGNKIKLCTCDEDSYYGEISAEVPLAESNINGLMSNEDKKKLDSFHTVMNENAPFIMTEAGIPGAYSWDDASQQMTFSSMEVHGNWFDGDKWEFTENNIFNLPDIPSVTTETGGVMSPADKSKLDGIDTETLPFVIELNGTLSSTNSWLNLSADVYAKLTEQTFRQPVFIRCKTSTLNTLIPATVYKPFSSNRLYLVFADGSGEFSRLTITLDSTTHKATSVTGKSFVPAWE